MPLYRKFVRMVVALFGAGIAFGTMSPCLADPIFTGPVSPLYIDNTANKEIYVVQGTNVINSFPWAYGPSCAKFCETNLAVTDVVSTNGTGSYSGVPSGQYTLGGAPTGIGWTDTPAPAGEDGGNTYYDGTSDGTHNYLVEYYGVTDTGSHTENVIETDLDWQNPVVLFSVQSAPDAYGEWLGITYDPSNNSLWLGYNNNHSATLVDYSPTGSLLTSFSTLPGFVATGNNNIGIGALAFDPADDTLWFSAGDNLLYQFSATGAFLQAGTPSALPYGTYYYAAEFAEGVPSNVPTQVPEPSSLVLFGTALIGLTAMLRRKRNLA